MTKEEKIDKILEFIKELFLLNIKDVDDKELDELYIRTKFQLETEKELKGSDKDA